MHVASRLLVLAGQEVCLFVILFVSMDPCSRVWVARAMVLAKTVALHTPCGSLSVLTILHAIGLISLVSRAERPALIDFSVRSIQLLNW